MWRNILLPCNHQLRGNHQLKGSKYNHQLKGSNLGLTHLNVTRQLHKITFWLADLISKQSVLLKMYPFKISIMKILFLSYCCLHLWSGWYVRWKQRGKALWGINWAKKITSWVSCKCHLVLCGVLTHLMISSFVKKNLYLVSDDVTKCRTVSDSVIRVSQSVRWCHTVSQSVTAVCQIVSHSVR